MRNGKLLRGVSVCQSRYSTPGRGPACATSAMHGRSQLRGQAAQPPSSRTKRIRRQRQRDLHIWRVSIDATIRGVVSKAEELVQVAEIGEKRERKQQAINVCRTSAKRPSRAPPREVRAACARAIKRVGQRVGRKASADKPAGESEGD